MKSVLHVIPSLHPYTGGPAMAVRRLSSILPRLGWNSAILTTRAGYNPVTNASDIGENVSLISGSSISGSSFWRFSRANWHRHIRGHDLIHIHTMWSPLTRAASRSAGQRGIPVVFTPHGMLDEYALNHKRLRKMVYLRLFERSNLKAARAIIYASDLERADAEAQCSWLPRGLVAPLGSDEMPAISELQGAPDLPTGRRLLFVGRLDPIKGLEQLIRAHRLVVDGDRDAHLIILGTGSDHYECTLHALVASLHLNANVHFLGFLEGVPKWSVIRSCVLFVLPSFHENFGIAAVEAMHAGLPCILSDRVNIWPDVIAAGGGVIVPSPVHPAELARSITQLLENPKMAKDMGASAFRLATNHFTWKSAAQAMVGCYEQVISRDLDGHANRIL